MALKTFFAELAMRGPLLLTGDELYLLSPRKKADVLQFSDTNVVLGLVPARKTADILKFYQDINREGIYRAKKEFIESRAQYKYQTSKERELVVDERRLFSFIVTELLPFLSGHKENVSDLLKEEIAKQPAVDAPQTNEQELLRRLEQAKNELRQEVERKGKPQFKDYAANEAQYLHVLAGNPALALNDKVYMMTKIPKERAQLTLSRNGKKQHFQISMQKSVKDVEAEYAGFLEWNAQLDSIDEFSEHIKEMQRIQLTAANNLEEIIRLQEFNDGDVGFLRKNGSVYIYQIIPPFAMLDPRPAQKGHCYEFPRCRVGIQIIYQNNQAHLGEPILFEAIWHPFVRDQNLEFQHLCGGHVPPRNNQPTVEWVAKALDDAKNLVMNGLTPESINMHGGNQRDGGLYFGVGLDNKLSERAITVEKAQEKGLHLSNYWEWEKG